MKANLARRHLVSYRPIINATARYSISIPAASKLSVDDLLAPLATKQETLSSLKKSLKPLAASSNPKNQPLPAPLPVRTQEKLDRAAAYEQTKEEVDKWSETMKRIREVHFIFIHYWFFAALTFVMFKAEHLSFPLQAPKPLKTSNLELSAKFKVFLHILSPTASTRTNVSGLAYYRT